MSTQHLLQDVFRIVAIDPDGKAFSRVSRMVCKGENYGMDLICDFNNEIYPLEADNLLEIVLSSKLNEDETAEDKFYNPRLKSALMDEYEYVMRGKVFKIKNPDSQGHSEIFISYGGLLMSLKGEAIHLQNIELDSYLYLLMKRK